MDNTLSKSEKYINSDFISKLNLIIMLIFASIEHPLINGFPYLGLSELYSPIFFSVTFIIHRHRIKELINDQTILILLSILVLILTNNFQTLINSRSLTSIKLIYLFLLSISITLSVDTRIKFFVAILIIPLSALIGSVFLEIFAVLNNGIYENYYIYRIHPYLGETRQFFGFSKTPNNLAMSLVPLLIFIIIIQILEKLNKKLIIINSIILLLLIYIILLTQSKSICVGVITLLIVYLKNTNIKLKIKVILLTMIVIIFQIIVHLIILNNSAGNIVNLRDIIGSENPIFQTSEFRIYVSQYFLLKKIAIQAIINNPLSGIGLGNFGSYAEKYSAINYEQLHTENPLPHSLYFSLFAENGIFIGLVITFLSISYLLKVDLKINLNGIIEFENYQKYAKIILIYFLIEGMNTDVQYNRYFWVIIGITITLKKTWFLNNSKSCLFK